MKYTVDIDTNAGFIQIFGTAEFGIAAEQPVAFQVRGRICLLENLRELLVNTLVHIKHLDDTYHDLTESYSEFERGFVKFIPGVVPLTAIVQQRQVTLIIGSRKFGEDAVKLADLMIAVDAAIAKYEVEAEAEHLAYEERRWD
jgi:hypothetical protein